MWSSPEFEAVGRRAPPSARQARGGVGRRPVFLLKYYKLKAVCVGSISIEESIEEEAAMDGGGPSSAAAGRAGGHLVRVEPLGVDIEVQAGETLIDAAWREGYWWPTVCFGQAECTACHVVVRSGDANLSEIGTEEARALQLLRTSASNLADVRLACRLEVCGPVTVEKRGVRKA
jgi:2Fe-2S ferredoxin